MWLKRWTIAGGIFALVAATIVIGAGYASTMLVVGRFAPAMRHTPEEFGLAAETVRFRSADGIALVGWWIVAKQPLHGTIVLAHGSDDNRSGMLSRAAFFSASGYNAFAIDLRAHGDSDGNYMTPGYLEALDILGAIDAAKRRGQKGPFIVLGHSYGAVAALWAGARSRDIAAVIADSALISTYATLKRAAAIVNADPQASATQKFGLMAVNDLAQQKWARDFTEFAYYVRTGQRIDPQYDDATEAVRRLGGKPVLFIVGEKDLIAPPEDSRRLYAMNHGSHSALFVVPGAGHNSTFRAAKPLYEATVLRFLGGALAIAAAVH